MNRLETTTMDLSEQDLGLLFNALQVYSMDWFTDFTPAQNKIFEQLIDRVEDELQCIGINAIK